MRVFKAKKKKQLDGRDKPLWIDVGFTMLQGEYDGRETYTLIDERTGEKYSLFAIERKQEPSQQPSYGDIPTSGPVPTEEGAGDVPF